MNNSILDERQLTDEILGLELLDAHQYWLKKRLLFNLLVGLSGLVSLLFFIPSFDISDSFGIILWGVVANGLYSFGYVYESYIITKTKNHQHIKRTRKWLFWLGTILYMIVSMVFPYVAFFLAPY